MCMHWRPGQREDEGLLGPTFPPQDNHPYKLVFWTEGVYIGSIFKVHLCLGPTPNVLTENLRVLVQACVFYNNSPGQF